MAVVLHQIAEKIQVFRLPVSVILPFSENCVPFVNDNHYPPSIIRINIIQCLDQIVIAEIINIRIFLLQLPDDQPLHFFQSFGNGCPLFDKPGHHYPDHIKFSKIFIPGSFFFSGTIECA